MIQLHNKNCSTMSFRVVEHQLLSEETRPRNEIKFAISNADVESLRQALQLRANRVVFHRPVSVVRSIYFDDWQRSACHANLDGVGDRRKLRLRWYDSPLPVRDMFLEVKWRRYRATGKHRLHLQTDSSFAEGPFGQWTYRQMIDEFQRIAPDEFVRSLWPAVEPTVLVEYQREHFVSPDGQIRLTLDRDLTFYDQTSKHRISLSFPQRRHDLTIVEVKGPVGMERELREVLGSHKLRVGRCSKYVEGCRQLGLISLRD